MMDQAPRDAAYSSKPLNIVADENIPGLEDWFGDLGNITRLPGRTMTREQLRDADVLLVRSVTPVNENLLRDTPVRFVGSCTIGTDHLDTVWLEQRGVAWSAAPGCNANSVVEYVFCALAALDIDWRDRTFGIVGCGNVGGLLQTRLHQLGLSVVVYDPWLPDNPDAATLETVLKQQIVCLHAPLVKAEPHPSLHMLDTAMLDKLADDAVLISAGRGAVIDNNALLARLQRNPAFTAVLDVWENEPDINLSLLEQVDLASPHIAGYSHDGKLAGTRMIREALDRSPGLRPVSASHKDPASETKVISTEQSGFAAIRDLLLQMYNPRDDDRRLRAAADAHKQGGLPMAEAFDLLRKQYPKRLEFSHFRASTSQLDKSTRQQLTALGLQCS
ncbi:4-phosphoerythronate dehydrogenase [Microbulbifer celer]|uniref:Erythronate-4-phosphate dehydrogenase n=1 Tax=Microbulbifer celer TaxID=435905 RepID=A0ABW3UBU2_9GAMM|nr:4-phosphoerythronate dehydrogenase [Microbulbifer celer]UFN59145.1 4-phosphoerythronate dehydrogenase [Microbulbifer celer]